MLQCTLAVVILQYIMKHQSVEELNILYFRVSISLSMTLNFNLSRLSSVLCVTITPDRLHVTNDIDRS